MKIEQYNQYNSVSNTATKTKGDNLVHVVSFSGGRTSAVLVWLMKIAMERYGWNVKFIFCDTGLEHPNTYKFIRDIIKFWGTNFQQVNRFLKQLTQTTKITEA